MIKKLLKKQDGFTFVELLAVIVILVIIAAIASPAIGPNVNNSRNKAEVNNALQIIDAEKLYVTDNNADTSSAQTINSSKLAPYLNGQNTSSSFTVYAAPESSTYSRVIYSPTEISTSDNTNQCPPEHDLQDCLNQHGRTPSTKS